MGHVFDDFEAVLFGDGHDRVHVAGVAAIMHGDYGARKMDVWDEIALIKRPYRTSVYFLGVILITTG